MRIIMYFWIYVLPLPLFILMAYAWQFFMETTLFTVYVLGLPVLYGYIVPGIATNILKKWRFKGKMLIGNYYLHHGFNYASKMSFILFISLVTVIPGTKLSLGKILAIIIVSGVFHAYVFWIADICLLKTDMLELHNAGFRKGKSAEEIVFQYAPLCFFLLGATYAISVLVAYEQLVCNQKGVFTLIWLMLGGLILLATIPSVAYGLVDRLQARESKR